jgi:serine phosphatase RsbU (regulator of sigma subunit)
VTVSAGPGTSEDLTRLATALSAASSPEGVLEAVADLGRPLLGARSVHLALLDDTGGQLRLMVAPRVEPAAAERHASVPVDPASPSGEALRTGRPVFLPDRAALELRYPHPDDLEREHGSWAVLPLAAGGRPLGVIGLGWSSPGDRPCRLEQDCMLVAELCAGALARALELERALAARAAAERTALRLHELQALTVELAQATDPAVVAALVVGAGVRALRADAGTIGVLENDGSVTVVASSGVGADRLDRFAHVEVGRHRLIREVIARRGPVLIGSLAERAERYPDLGASVTSLESWVTVPLLLHGEVRGLASFGRREPHAFSDQEVGFAAAIASHAAIALDRSALLARAQDTAETMQRALMPKTLTRMPGWSIASWYVPAVRGTQVGGDWYDAFRVPGGRIAVLVGDVTGKGIPAATVMGSVRSAARAYAITDPDPGSVLTRLDQYFAAFKGGELVTCCLAVLDPETGALDYACAGHPPPLLVGRAGHRWLDEATTPPLGAGEDVTRVEARTVVAPGEALLLYTDGLVERRDQDLFSSLDALAAAAAVLPDAPDLEAATGRLIGELAHPARTVDDIALLALRRCPTT